MGPVRFCHATGRADTEMVLVDSPVDLYREAFAGSDEPTLVLGHTHMPFDRLADRRVDADRHAPRVTNGWGGFRSQSRRAGQHSQPCQTQCTLMPPTVR